MRQWKGSFAKKRSFWLIHASFRSVPYAFAYGKEAVFPASYLCRKHRNFMPPLVVLHKNLIYTNNGPCTRSAKPIWIIILLFSNSYHLLNWIIDDAFFSLDISWSLSLPCCIVACDAWRNYANNSPIKLVCRSEWRLAFFAAKDWYLLKMTDS